MSDILSIFKSLFDLTQAAKREKLKSILAILIILTIVLVKPTVYYATQGNCFPRFVQCLVKQQFFGLLFP